MAEWHIQGRGASPGLAEGQVIVLESKLRPMRPVMSPDEEMALLQDAIGAALAETEALMARTGGDGADMLGFQAALLADDNLSAPAHDLIRAGAPARNAWSMTLDAEIAHYAASPDEIFQARTADFREVRDRVWRTLAVPGPAHPPLLTLGAVIVAAELPLHQFLAVDWSRGGAIVLTQGSPASHVATLARARDIPMIVGIGGGLDGLAGCWALVDADAGTVVLQPGDVARAAFARRRQVRTERAATTAEFRDRPAVTADGTPIAVHLTIGDPAELHGLDPARCSGIGLVRTELMFGATDGLPDEQTQYEAYRDVALWAQGRPVTIRTLDAGGDKLLQGMAQAETSPFLGLRGIRLSLRRPGLLQTQFRALARAAIHGAIRIMLPMVTIPAEFDAARHILDAVVAELETAAIPGRRPPLGMMVEVPAAALLIDRFDAAFFSIGSNDLTQYVMAAGRDIGAVADLADPRNPAVLELIGRVVRCGRATGREAGLCGDAGADPLMIPHLLRAGVRSLSVAPSAVGRVKQAIAGVDLRPGDRHAGQRDE